MPEAESPQKIDPRESLRDLDRVDLFFTSLDKSLRGFKLYQGQGAIVDRMLDELQNVAEAMLGGGPVVVRVASIGIVFQGRRVTEDAKRVPYLFRLFCDGVRELTFLPELTREELQSLVEVLASDPKAGLDDMVTLLWRKNLTHIRYYAADTLAEGMDVDAEGELVLTGSRGGLYDRNRTGSASVTLSSQDFKVLVSEGQRDWLKLAHAPAEPEGKAADAAHALKQAYSNVRDNQRFVDLVLRGTPRAQTSPLLIGYIEALIAAGQTFSLCECFRALANVPPDQAESARAHMSILGRPETMVRLSRMAERSPDQLVISLEPFVSLAREGLIALLNTLSGLGQEQLLDVLIRGGVDLTPYYGERSRMDDENLAIPAIRALGLLGTPEAIKHLSTALSRNSSGIRRAVLESMLGHYHPEARVAIARAMKDPVRENRLLAAKVIASSGDARCAWGLLSLVGDERFDEVDQEEQVQIYAALASFKDNRTVAHLDEILSRKNLFRNKAVIARQLLVVKALTEVGTDEARKTLEKYRGFKAHPEPVQAAIGAALNKSRRS